jgi:hypothetical protein
MNQTPQSEWHKLARSEFPGARIEGDGPYGLIPCSPTGKMFLFWTQAETVAAKNHWPCGVMCFGNHRGVTLRPPRPRPTNIVYRSPSLIEKEKA